MTNEDRTQSSRISIEKYNELQSDYDTLKKSMPKNRAGFFTLGGGVGAIITAALLMHSCYGTKTTTSQTTQNIPNCKSEAPIINVYCEKSCKSDSENDYDSGKNKPKYDNKQCPKGKTCLDSDLENRLEVCLEENENLQKRPKHCPAYTPKECPPVKKCPEIPYRRKGD